MRVKEQTRERLKRILHDLFASLGISLQFQLTQTRDEIETELDLLRLALSRQHEHFTHLLQQQHEHFSLITRNLENQISSQHTELTITRFFLQRENQSTASVLRDDIRRLSNPQNSMADRRRKTPRVCFILPYTYSVFNTNTSYIFGGSEVRASIFAKALAASGDFDVYFVVNDHGQMPLELHDKVRIYRATSFLRPMTSPPDTIWPEGRPLKPLQLDDLTLLEENLTFVTNIDADLYCVFGIHNFASHIARICQLNNRKLVIFAGSDGDFSDIFKPGSIETDKYGNVGWLGHYAISSADQIITQTTSQADLLLKRFGRQSITLRNPIDLRNTKSLESQSSLPPPSCLWIGKSDQVKQPNLLIDLANRLPSFKFTMVLNRSDSEMHDEIIRIAPPNVHIIDRISIDKIEELFLQSKVLLNTSVFEGFPNTFLQAGKYGLPIFSLNVDPDGFIQHYECGFIAHGDQELMATELMNIVNNADRYKQMSNNVREYVIAHHDLETISSDLNRIVQQIIDSPSNQ